jgi:hypothetical protein
MKVSLLTGGSDKTYAFGLALSLLGKNIELDFIGSNELMDEDILKKNNIKFLNLRGDQNPRSSMYNKAIRILKYYCKLGIYAMQTDSRLFHILWLNKFTFFDRTMLNIYYKLLGKKLVFTAHNVDQKERDGEFFIKQDIIKNIIQYSGPHFRPY